MARQIEITENGGDGGGPGTGDPGDGDYTPPTSTGAKIAVVISNSNVTFTYDQISAAGGPWPAFRVRVTPMNANGAGPAAEVACAVAPPAP